MCSYIILICAIWKGLTSNRNGLMWCACAFLCTLSLPFQSLIWGPIGFLNLEVSTQILHCWLILGTELWLAWWSLRFSIKSFYVLGDFCIDMCRTNCTVIELWWIAQDVPLRFDCTVMLNVMKAKASAYQEYKIKPFNSPPFSGLSALHWHRQSPRSCTWASFPSMSSTWSSPDRNGCLSDLGNLFSERVYTDTLLTWTLLLTLFFGTKKWRRHRPYQPCHKQVNYWQNGFPFPRSNLRNSCNDLSPVMASRASV